MRPAGRQIPGRVQGWIWREIAITPFSDEARWREGCATGEVLTDMTLPLKRGKVVNGREQLLIGGELFELDDDNLYRSNGMALATRRTISSAGSRAWMCAVHRAPAWWLAQAQGAGVW